MVQAPQKRAHQDFQSHQKMAHQMCWLHKNCPHHQCKGKEEADEGVYVEHWWGGGGGEEWGGGEDEGEDEEEGCEGGALLGNIASVCRAVTESEKSRL